MPLIPLVLLLAVLAAGCTQPPTYASADAEPDSLAQDSLEQIGPVFPGPLRTDVPNPSPDSAATDSVAPRR